MSIFLGNRLRKKLLTYSFTHPEESYYVRELSSFIDADPGNLSRELKKMEEEGLFLSSTRGRLKLYQLNKSYPLFAELKKIIFKTEGVEGSLRKLVERYKSISLAFIYGSYARNEEKKLSDIDLVVVGDFSQHEFTREIRKLEGRLSREINFTAYSQGEFHKKSQTEGSFLSEILAGKKILIKGALKRG
jgi:predicted nucleotidyltransferase